MQITQRIALLIGVLAVGLAPTLQAAVLTFDDINTTPPLGQGLLEGEVHFPGSAEGTPGVYGGFIWDVPFGSQCSPATSVVSEDWFSNWEVESASFPSGPNAVAFRWDWMTETSAGGTVRLATGGAFDFLGAQFSSYPSSYSPQPATLTVEGYRGGVLVGSRTLNLMSSDVGETDFTWHDVNLLGIDELHLMSGVHQDDYGYNVHEAWLMDDFTYSAVPDGGVTALLLVLGIAGLGLTRKWGGS